VGVKESHEEGQEVLQQPLGWREQRRKGQKPRRNQTLLCFLPPLGSQGQYQLIYSLKENRSSLMSKPSSQLFVVCQFPLERDEDQEILAI
jgi:hypothetical protein